MTSSHHSFPHSEKKATVLQKPSWPSITSLGSLPPANSTPAPVASLVLFKHLMRVLALGPLLQRLLCLKQPSPSPHIGPLTPFKSLFRRNLLQEACPEHPIQNGSLPSNLKPTYLLERFLPPPNIRYNLLI